MIWVKNDWDTFELLTVLVFCTKIGLDSSKVQKPEKNQLFLARFKHFSRFFNSSQIVAQNTSRLIFFKVFCFIWHPSHQCICQSNSRKKRFGHFNQCGALVKEILIVIKKYKFCGYRLQSYEVLAPKCWFPNESQKVKKFRSLICLVWG